MARPKISVINGPNLNLLGKREPDHYGHQTLLDIQNALKSRFDDSCALDFFQSNNEGELIDRIQSMLSDNPRDGIVINPGAFTHTSIAIRDALAAVQKPFIEVHLSNVYRREPFRHKSYFSDLAIGVICGFGPVGYRFAVEAMLDHLKHG